MIRNIVVLHLGHLPFIALLVVPPLPFMVTSLASDISLLLLHFTQYASTIFKTPHMLFFSQLSLYLLLF